MPGFFPGLGLGPIWGSRKIGSFAAEMNARAEKTWFPRSQQGVINKVP